MIIVLLIFAIGGINFFEPILNALDALVLGVKPCQGQLEVAQLVQRAVHQVGLRRQLPEAVLEPFGRNQIYILLRKWTSQLDIFEALNLHLQALL